MPIPVKLFPITLRSSTGEISVQFSPSGIGEVVRIASEIWQQASISVLLQNIDERTLVMPGTGSPHLNDPVFFFIQSQLRDGNSQVVKAAITGQTGHNLHGGMATIGGRFCLLPWGPGGETMQRRGKVLAHELGHLMGLPDFTGSLLPGIPPAERLAITNNLMASTMSMGTRLTQNQIESVGSSPLSRL